VTSNVRGKTLSVVLAVTSVSLAILATFSTVELIDANQQLSLKECQLEYETVQLGIDSYVSDNHVDSVTPATTTDMTTPLALYVSDASGARPRYVPMQRTQWAYTWDPSGRVTGISEAYSGVAVPAGCVPRGV